MGTNAYNFDFTILHLQFHSQFYNCSFAFAFCICILSFANLHLQFSFLYGVSQNFGNKTIYNFAFLEAFAVLTLQFVNAVLCFWTTFPECICNFDISYFNCNFAFPDCHCIFCFLEANAVLHFLEAFLPAICQPENYKNNYKKTNSCSNSRNEQHKTQCTPHFVSPSSSNYMPTVFSDTHCSCTFCFLIFSLESCISCFQYLSILDRRKAISSFVNVPA